MDVSIAEVMEFAMLFAFGFSWPFAILKTWRAKRVDGKSPMFMTIVLVGYMCGIAARLLDGASSNDWLCIVYLVDMALVSTDLALYFRYSRRNRNDSLDRKPVCQPADRGQSPPAVLADGEGVRSLWTQGCPVDERFLPCHKGEAQEGPRVR